MNTPTERFARLHENGFFLLPNAWDAGSAVRLEGLGFSAIATTSSGFARSLGRNDQEVSFPELCRHVEQMAAVVDIPLSVDGERLFADDPAGVAANVERLADLGAAGVSIEDYDPSTGSIDPIQKASERVEAAADAAGRRGLTLTARAENLLYGIDDLDDTIARLRAFRLAGADVVYAPGLVSEAAISAVVRAVDCPVNVLLRPDGPAPDTLRSLGVRRASTGGRLSVLAYEAMEREARRLLESVPPR